MALTRQPSINPALRRNHTTAGGIRKPANHTSPSEGNPRVAGCPPAPPTSPGHSVGVGFSPLSGEAAEPVKIAAQGPSVHGADLLPLTPAADASVAGEFLLGGRA